jgi:hypothetical protein
MGCLCSKFAESDEAKVIKFIDEPEHEHEHEAASPLLRNEPETISV